MQAIGTNKLQNRTINNEKTVDLSVEKVEKIENKCKCGEIIFRKSKICKKCWGLKQRKVERPSLEILLEEIGNLGYCGTGRKYGVSDNTIRKWIKFYEKYMMPVLSISLFVFTLL